LAESSGGGPSRLLDYYEIVALGATPRDHQVQNEVEIDAGRPENGRFELSLRPLEFVPERVVVTDIHGEVVLDLSR
jgi:hypothetical protein